MTEERQVWGSKLQFLLTCIGYSVGLGNLWKFPGIAYENGGGAFLLPYVICSFCIGLPCLYLELFIGQYLRTGAAKAFRYYKPIFQGLGWTSTVMSAMVGIFYNMIVAICILYLKDALMGYENTWSECNNSWNTKNCTTLSNPNFNAYDNETLATDEFFDISYFGKLNVELLIALASMWFLTCVCLLKGVSWIGKISYVTATVPYFIIGCLFINGLFLDGAWDGIKEFLIPRVHKLTDYTTWVAAANQLCLSLSIGYGGILSLASFNEPNHNCFKDAAIVVFADGFMSIFGGCVVYGTLGYVSKLTKMPISRISKAGQSGLAFTVYPIALKEMPFGRWLACALFFMFFLLGISSQFGLSQNIATSITDQFPRLAPWSWLVVIGVCLTSFLIAFVTCFQNGNYLQSLLSNNTGGTSIFLVVFLEIIIVIHIYGIHNFMKDLRSAIGEGKTRISKYFGSTGYFLAGMWFCITPVVLLVLIGFSIKNCVTKKYDDSPTIWEYAVSVTIEFAPLLMIPLFFIINLLYFCRSPKGWTEAFRIQPEHPSYVRVRGATKVYPQDETKV